MPKKFDEGLGRLKNKLLFMGALAERIIASTMTGLINWNATSFESVQSDEEKMDLLQREIDEETIRLISVYTPVASDLRFLLTVTRINSELERIADQAMNISFYSKQMMQCPPIRPLSDLGRMGEIGIAMLKDALDAFTSSSAEKAIEVMETDDQVDTLNDALFKDLMACLVSDPGKMKQVLELILTGRALERIADHAVSICEDVYYMAKGEDIRHVHKVRKTS